MGSQFIPLPRLRHPLHHRSPRPVLDFLLGLFVGLILLNNLICCTFVGRIKIIRRLSWSCVRLKRWRLTLLLG